jgi:hypothetical protein
MSFLARLFGWLRRRPQQAVYDEHDAYERFYGERTTEIVVTPKPPPGPRVLPKLRGDYLQRCFEERLEGRRGVGPRLVESVSVSEDPAEVLLGEAAAAARARPSDAMVEAKFTGS